MSQTRLQRITWTAACSLLALAWVSVAHAGLYRCELADGKVVYTDNASKCPGAEPHEPRGAIQTMRTHGPPVTSKSEDSRANAARGLDDAVSQSQKAVWQQKKERKEIELQNAEARGEYLRQFVTYCNRGGEVISKDKKSGLKHKVKCNDVRSEYETMEKRRAALTKYLNGGIQKECRKAGCLPGWLR